MTYARGLVIRAWDSVSLYSDTQGTSIEECRYQKNIFDIRTAIGHIVQINCHFKHIAMKTLFAIIIYFVSGFFTRMKGEFDLLPEG